MMQEKSPQRQKRAKKAKELEARKQKLKAGQPSKEDKQGKEKEHAPMDTDKMLELESDSENDDHADTSKGARKKKCLTKKQLTKPLWRN